MPKYRPRYTTIPTQEMTKPRYRPAMPSVAIVLRYTSTRPLNSREPPFLALLLSLARRVRA